MALTITSGGNPFANAGVGGVGGGGSTTIITSANSQAGPPSLLDGGKSDVVVLSNQNPGFGVVSGGQLPPWQDPAGQNGQVPGQQDPKNDRLARLEEKLDQMALQNQQGNKGTDMKELMMMVAMMKQGNKG
jgi:hypothetical protein